MLTPWKESYGQPRQCIKKQRHYFANKRPSIKAMVFPVVMYGCESWSIMKAECRRTDVEPETPILLPPDVRADSLETTLMLEKIECRKRRGQQRIRCLDFIPDTMDMSLSKLSER